MRLMFWLIAITSVGAFVHVPPTTPQRTAMKAGVEVPLRKFESGESVGTEVMDLKTARSGKDMYIVHKAYVKERRDQRAGTASTKTRGEVRGGGRKPYKQKGTGNARRGSTRSPLIVGGGVAHGPKPKNWANKKINKKEQALAVSIAIQNKANRVCVVDGLVGKMEFPPKTKIFKEYMKKLDIDPSDNCIMVVDEYDEILDKSSRNIPKFEMRLQHKISVADMLWANNIIFSKPAFDYVSEKFKRSEPAPVAA